MPEGRSSRETRRKGANRGGGVVSREAVRMCLTVAPRPHHLATPLPYLFFLHPQSSLFNPQVYPLAGVELLVTGFVRSELDRLPNPQTEKPGNSQALV